MKDFEEWLRKVCFQKPTPEAYDLAKSAWKEAENEWISAKDRLPPFDEYVLVYCKIYGRYLTSYSGIGDTGYGNWRDPEGMPGGLPPTHWQPLPEPPEEEV